MWPTLRTSGTWLSPASLIIGLLEGQSAARSSHLAQTLIQEQPYRTALDSLTALSVSRSARTSCLRGAAAAAPAVTWLGCLAAKKEQGSGGLRGHYKKKVTMKTSASRANRWREAVVGGKRRTEMPGSSGAENSEWVAVSWSVSVFLLVISMHGGSKKFLLRGNSFFVKVFAKTRGVIYGPEQLHVIKAVK